MIEQYAESQAVIDFNDHKTRSGKRSEVMDRDRDALVIFDGAHDVVPKRKVSFPDLATMLAHYMKEWPTTETHVINSVSQTSKGHLCLDRAKKTEPFRTVGYTLETYPLKQLSDTETTPFSERVSKEEWEQARDVLRSGSTKKPMPSWVEKMQRMFDLRDLIKAQTAVLEQSTQEFDRLQFEMNQLRVNVRL